MRIATVMLVLSVSTAPPTWTSLDAAFADGSVTSDSIDVPSTAWEQRVEWGLERFEAAGLELPPMSITVHDSTVACGGNTGLFRPLDPVEVHLCAQRPDSTAARLITLHELAHAWAETQLDDDVRACFVRSRNLEAWIDDRLPRHEWGAEHAAEVVSWGLMDTSIPIIRIYDAEPDQLADAFDALVGGPPVWLRTATTKVARPSCRDAPASTFPAG